jgi:esterase/lipase superfamily enzyme
MISALAGRIDAGQLQVLWAVALGCSFGGYHAANIALRHPAFLRGCFRSPALSIYRGFLSGYYDQDCYFNLPSLSPRPLPPQHLRAGDGLG